MKKLNLPGQLRGHERERIDSWKILMAIILGEVLRIHELHELNWFMVNGREFGLNREDEGKIMEVG